MASNMKSRLRDQAETDIYINFVDSLFADRRAVLLGLVLQVAISLFVVIESRSAVMAVWPVLLMIATGSRFIHIRNYENNRAELMEMPDPQRLKTAQLWERRFTVSSALSGLMVGGFAWTAIELIGSEFAIIAGLSTVFAAVPTIVGRLSGSIRLASILLSCVLCAPAFSLLSKGTVSSVGAFLLFIPYIVLVLSMVRNVRSTVVTAVRGKQINSELAERFDTALENMSHGLIMFDSDANVLVMNRAARLLLQIPQYVRVEDRPFDALLRYGRRYEMISSRNMEALQRAIEGALTHAGDKVELPLANGRLLELSANRRPDGGSVLILEDVTERARAENKIRTMAQYDGLTELPNRTFFAAEVERRISRLGDNAGCVLIAFDVDDFKRVNDSIGHAQGDALLKAIGKRLRRHYGRRAIMSRLGGDEFMMFIDHDSDAFPLEGFAEGLSACLSRAYRVGPEQVLVSQSIGIDTCMARDFRLEEAMIRADLALYNAKTSGKGVWSTYTDGMGDRYMRRQKLKNDLARAIEEGQLTTLYQPIVDSETGRMVACEALARWHHPTLGPVSPTEFVILAEEMGIISQLTRHVLDLSLRDCAQWPAHVGVSVNLSAVDFRRDNIADILAEAIAASGVNAGRLEVEITESAILSNDDDVIARLERIRRLGVGISLDDFGTGYSSLSYLHRLPLDRVKIDRSFVVGIETGKTPLALLEGITSLCRKLNLAITVEGIETEAQLELVRSTGKVARVQGFLFGPGLPASAIAEVASRFATVVAAEPSLEPYPLAASR